jgi:tRNA(Leu) C34 or U34 (ribose-2'-O)-methylase TrmL
MLPAVVLLNPKYPHNVGGVLRACAAFNVPTLRWTGERVSLAAAKQRRQLGRSAVLSRRSRLPREERMKGYAQVDWRGALDSTTVLDEFDGTPVTVEVDLTAEPLSCFEHPEDAVYVFGPEDGSVTKALRVRCHRFVVIPTAYCLNLAAAVNIVLYDRRIKRQAKGLEPLRVAEILRDGRGTWDAPEEIP